MSFPSNLWNEECIFRAACGAILDPDHQGNSTQLPPLFSEAGFWRYPDWAIWGSAAFGGRKFCYFGVSIQGGNAPKARENFGFYALYKRQNRPKFAKILVPTHQNHPQLSDPPLVFPSEGPEGGGSLSWVGTDLFTRFQYR